MADAKLKVVEEDTEKERERERKKEKGVSLQRPLGVRDF